MPESVDLVKQSDGDVLELVHAVMHQFRARQYQALRDAAHGTTHMEGKVLGFFARRPGATLSDLVQHSQRDKAQLARLIKSLRERALLDGTPDPQDRRNLRLSVTAEGQALQKALRRQARQLATRALAGLDEAERTQLQALLERVLRNLEAEA